MSKHAKRFREGAKVATLLTVAGMVLFIFLVVLSEIFLQIVDYSSHNPETVSSMIIFFSTIISGVYILGYLTTDFKEDYKQWRGEE